MAREGAAGESPVCREVDSACLLCSGSEARRSCIFAQIAGGAVMLPLVLDGVITVDGISGFKILSECTPVGCDGERKRVFLHDIICLARSNRVWALHLYLDCAAVHSILSQPKSQKGSAGMIHFSIE